MTVDSAAIGSAAIGIGQTVVAYQFFLPRISEVRQAHPGDATMRADVMMGQLAAGAVTVSIGALLAWMTGSALPVLVSVFVAAVIAALYQYALGTGGETA